MWDILKNAKFNYFSFIICTPTVQAGSHPLVFYAFNLVNTLQPKLKFASVVGSYSCNSKTVEQIASLISNLKVEIKPVLCKGDPQQVDFAALDNLAEEIANKHKERQLI